MLKARRKEPTEQLKFPEPREGLPLDPRPFMGSQHLVASAAVQEQLSARCLVAVVGRVGSGKSTVCRRAANSRWARQWFLHDEGGQPVHRRFWVDLEDASPGADTEAHVAHALDRPTFAEALARLGSGKPCLLVLDNADHAFGEADQGDTLAQLVACVQRGASIIMTRRSVSGLTIDRPWTDVVEVSGFVSHNEARELFEQLAPRHATDLRVGDVVAACDRLPAAVNLLGRATADADLELARLRVDSNSATRSGLDFAVEVAAATVDPEGRQLWAALSLLPAGLSSDDIRDVFAAAPDARERTVRLFDAGVAHRCEAGVRIPAPLRLSCEAANLHDVAVSGLWRGYLRRARSVVGPGPDWASLPDGATGISSSAMASPRTEDRVDRVSRLDRPANRTPNVDAWLARQVPNLGRLASLSSLPDGTFELGCAGLLVRRSGTVEDSVDQAMVRLIVASMGVDPSPQPADPSESIAPRDLERANRAAGIAAELEDQRRFETSALVAAAVADGHRRAGRTKGEAEALCQMGRCERFLGRYHDAEVHLSEARQHFEKLDDSVGQGSALFELGQVDLDVGRLDDAESHLGEALVLFHDNGRPVGEANANLELVRVDLARGRPDSAERRLADALDRYEVAGDRLGFANACLQLGQVELARGHLDGAERHFAGALDGYEQGADKVGFANACLQLGQVELARGRLEGAERRFGAALAGYEQAGDKVGVAHACLQMGQIDLARGRLEHAGQRLHQALTAYQHLGDRIGLANASLLLGQVHLAQGELDEADQELRAARATYDEIGDPMGSANSRRVGAMLRQAQDLPSESTALFGEAARLYSSIGRTALSAWSMAGAARICTGKAERRGYAADAVRLLNEAGLAEAATQLEAELAEPQPEFAEPQPELAEPQPELAEPQPELAEPQPEPEPTPEPASPDPDLSWDPKWKSEPIGTAPDESDTPARQSEGTWSPKWPSDWSEIQSAPVDEWTSGWQPGAAPLAAAAHPTDLPPGADHTETSTQLQWPEPPATPATEDLALPPDRLQYFDDAAAPAPEGEQTLFGDVPRKSRRRWGRRKDE